MSSPSADPRPIPAPQVMPENRPFWDGANAGQLLLKGCRACGRLHWYPRALCPWCLSDETEWRPAQGGGTIYSYTFSGATAIAYVRLDEGVVMLANVLGAEPAQLRVGAPVRLCFAAAQDGQKVPMFTLLEERGTP